MSRVFDFTIGIRAFFLLRRHDKKEVVARLCAPGTL